MVKEWHAILLLVLSLILAACAGLPGVGADQQRLPTPVEIQIAAASDIRTLTPTDEPFQAAVDALPAVVDNIDTQARTLFSPQRFAQEIEPGEHVYLRFAEDVRFTGQEISWTASELVIASPGGEPMLLARAANIDDWSVYLPADPTIVADFLDAMLPP